MIHNNKVTRLILEKSSLNRTFLCTLVFFIQIVCLQFFEISGASLASAMISNPSHLRELGLWGNDLQVSGVKLLSDLKKNPHCRLKLNICIYIWMKLFISSDCLSVSAVMMCSGTLYNLFNFVLQSNFSVNLMNQVSAGHRPHHLWSEQDRSSAFISLTDS